MSLQLLADILVWVTVLGIGYYVWKTDEHFRWSVIRYVRNTKIKMLRLVLERVQIHLSYYCSIFEELTHFSIDGVNIERFEEQLSHAEEVSSTYSYSTEEREEINHATKKMRQLKRIERFIFRRINRIRIVKFNWK